MRTTLGYLSPQPPPTHITIGEGLSTLLMISADQGPSGGTSRNISCYLCNILKS